MNHLVWIMITSTLSPQALLEAEVEVTADEGGLELRIAAPARLLSLTERHLSGKNLVLYVPGITASPEDRSLDAGPVVQLRRKPVAKGLVFILQPRAGVSVDRLRLRPTADGLRLTDRLPASERPARAAATDPQEARAEMPSPEPATAVVDTTPLSTAAASASPAQPNEPPSRALSGPRTFTGATPAATSPTGLIGTLVLLGVGGIAVLLWTRRRRISRGAGPQLEIVAVKGMGGRHQLALVDADGDRLLVATSTQGVQLISHLGRSDTGETSFAAALQNAQPDLDTTPPSSDVAGIIRLRRPTEPRPTRRLGVAP